MASNGAGELAELEARNQQTTAYPTLSCVAGPMSPAYTGGPSCDVDNLQERTHAITPYRTDGTALLPQFNQQRSSACASMEMQGVGMEPPNPRLVTRASGEPPIGYAPHVYAYPQFGPQTPAVRFKKNKKRSSVPPKALPLKYIPMRTFNSVRGALYDMKHFGDLPPAQSGASPSTIAYFALTRDGRTPYLLIGVTIILAVVAVVLLVRSGGKQKTS